MLGLLLWLTFFLFVFLLVTGLILKRMTKQAIKDLPIVEQDLRHFTVRQSLITKVFLWGIFLLLVFVLVIEIIDAAVTQFSLEYLVLLVGMPTFLFLLCRSYVWKVEVTDERIHYTSIGKNELFKFKDITRVRIKERYDLVIYCREKRMFTVEGDSKCYDHLLIRLQMQGVYFEDFSGNPE